jgi:hypothetical protein
MEGKHFKGGRPMDGKTAQRTETIRASAWVDESRGGSRSHG